MAKRFAIIGDLCAESRGEEVCVGGSGAIATALRDLDGQVTLRSRVGDDQAGNTILDQIKAARIHPGNIELIPGVSTTTLTRLNSGEVTDYAQGVMMTMAGRIDTFGLFSHDALIVDLQDERLRKFLIDLPAHQDGTVRMLVTLNHLDHADPFPTELDELMRTDIVVGTEAQFCKLTGEDTASEALGVMFNLMPINHLRAAVAVTEIGIDVVARDTRVLKPVQDAIPSLLLPQVVAGMAWGLANHLDWDQAAAIAVDPSLAS